MPLGDLFSEARHKDLLKHIISLTRPEEINVICSLNSHIWNMCCNDRHLRSIIVQKKINRVFIMLSRPKGKKRGHRQAVICEVLDITQDLEFFDEMLNQFPIDIYVFYKILELKNKELFQRFIQEELNSDIIKSMLIQIIRAKNLDFLSLIVDDPRFTESFSNKEVIKQLATSGYNLINFVLEYIPDLDEGQLFEEIKSKLTSQSPYTHEDITTRFNLYIPIFETRSVQVFSVLKHHIVKLSKTLFDLNQKDPHLTEYHFDPDLFVRQDVVDTFVKYVKDYDYVFYDTPESDVEYYFDSLANDLQDLDQCLDLLRIFEILGIAHSSR